MEPAETLRATGAEGTEASMSEPGSKLTPLAVMVLCLLREDDMHPYEMKRLMLLRRDDRLVKITNGSLYHTVSRLAQAGLVAEVGSDRDGNRPERTTYSITDAGRLAVTAWVHRALPVTHNEAEFRVALSAAHILQRDEVTALLHQRRAALALVHEELQVALLTARERKVPEQYVIDADRDEYLAAAELRWLDTLLSCLSDPQYPWGGNDPLDSPHSAHYIAQRKAARQ